MTKLSLLYLNEAERAKLTSVFFTDTELDRVFSRDVISVIGNRLTCSEIKARQEIFAQMKNGDFYKFLDNIRMLLAKHSQYEQSVINASTRIEKHFCIYGYAESYALAVKAFKNEYNGVFCKRLSDFYESEREALERLEALLQEYFVHINKVRSHSMRIIAGRATLGQKQDRSDAFTFEKALSDMGFDADIKPRHFGVRINRSLSDAMERAYPNVVSELKRLSDEMLAIIKGGLLTLRSDIDFYTSVYRVVTNSREKGVYWCLPKVADKPIYSAKRVSTPSLLILPDVDVVPNDISFDTDSSVYYLTGANGGGKTTYLRTVAACLAMFASGCPIPAEDAEIYPFKNICTHFPADERFTDSGRLAEEEKRVDELLSSCDKDSFYFFNETFAGTNEIKGAELTVQTAKNIKSLGAFALFVTHFHQVTESGGIPTLYTVLEGDENKRTYRIVGGLNLFSSYSADILKKYRLDAASLEKRKGER